MTLDSRKALIFPMMNERWPLKAATTKNLIIWQGGCFFLFEIKPLSSLFTFKNTNLADVPITL